MSYKLTFLESAHKEWKKLAPPIRRLFKAKLEKILDNPHIPKNKLSGMNNCYKIKLRSIGYRLVYRVLNERIVVQVISIGKRDKNLVYTIAQKRLS